jgi:hypothetical protein
MSTKVLQDKNLSGSEREKLVFLNKTIKQLVSSQHLLNEICIIVNSAEKVQIRKSKFTN